MLAKYDVPVLAAGVKLWALELDPPLTLWDGWDDIRKLYPTGKLALVQVIFFRLTARIVGSAKTAGEASEQQHLQDLQVVLLRLPRVHLYVLDALVSHLRRYI
jgi:hypothetical protein